MKNLTEGMQANDLDFLVMPIISIDEYESKIDDRRAVVIGFYVTDVDPATELSAFIEKGNVPVLDTEVSPAPTEDGYYIVFVEMDRNEKLPKAIMELIDGINRLTNVEDWQFSPYHSKEDENYPLTIEQLKDHVNCDPESIEVQGDDEVDIKTESIAGFMRDALIESFSVGDDVLTISTSSIHKEYQIVEIGEGEPDIQISAPMIGDNGLFESTCLQSMLGYQYQVYASDQGMLILNDGRFMLLKEID